MASFEITSGAVALLDICRAAGLTLATAESCTGGLVAASLVDVPGSSSVVERGFVTYSNAAKTDLLGVSPALIVEHGAVSAEVAAAMAEGALVHSPADLAIAITGVAGPGGGSADKPEGLVHFAVARRGAHVVGRKMLFGPLGRTAVRHASVLVAFQMMTEAADQRS